MLQNLENALPAQQFAGPHGSGGYCAQLSTLMPDAAWRRFSDSGLTAVAGCCAPGNDGCLLLTPGTGCRGEGDSVADGDNPSDDCMTNRRFRSMFALWTVNSFNLLLTGDFAQLNSFVMGTWTNDVSRHDIAATWVAFFSRRRRYRCGQVALAINQDPLGVAARRIDNASALSPGAVLHSAQEEEPAEEPERLGAGLGRNVAPMMAPECGGEPEDQRWTWNGTSLSGVLYNAATDTW